MLDMSTFFEKVTALFGGSSAGNLIGHVDPADLLDRAGIDAAGLAETFGVGGDAEVAGDGSTLGQIADQIKQLRSE